MSQSATDTHAILHRLEIECSPERLYQAIESVTGLQAWWTPMVEREGDTLRFRFGGGSHGPNMHVDHARPNESIQWTCTEGPWPGMTFHFEIESHQRGAVLSFAHRGWPEQDSFFMHCNGKWAFFLIVSLKSYLETGTGIPHPKEPSF